MVGQGEIILRRAVRNRGVVEANRRKFSERIVEIEVLNVSALFVGKMSVYILVRTGRSVNGFLSTQAGGVISEGGRRSALGVVRELSTEPRHCRTAIRRRVAYLVINDVLGDGIAVLRNTDAVEHLPPARAAACAVGITYGFITQNARLRLHREVAHPVIGIGALCRTAAAVDRFVGQLALGVVGVGAVVGERGHIGPRARFHRGHVAHQVVGILVPVVRQQFCFDQMGRIVPAPRRLFVGIVGIQRGAAGGQGFLRQASDLVVRIIHVRRRGDLVPCGKVVFGIFRCVGKAGNGAVEIPLQAAFAVHGERDARQIVALVVTELRRADIGVGGIVEDVVTDQSADAVVIVAVLFDVDAVAVLADRIVRRIAPRIEVKGFV